MNYISHFQCFLPLNVSAGYSHRQVAHGTLNAVEVSNLLLLV